MFVFVFVFVFVHVCCVCVCVCVCVCACVCVCVCVCVGVCVCVCVYIYIHTYAQHLASEGGKEEGKDAEEVENPLGNMLADLCAIPGTCGRALQALGLWKPTEDLVEMWNHVRSSSFSLDQIQKGRSRGASSPSL